MNIQHIGDKRYSCEITDNDLSKVKEIMNIIHIKDEDLFSPLHNKILFTEILCRQVADYFIHNEELKDNATIIVYKINKTIYILKDSELGIVYSIH
jgi:hypothetical protein